MDFFIGTQQGHSFKIYLRVEWLHVLRTGKQDLVKLIQWEENSMEKLKTPKMEFMQWQQKTYLSFWHLQNTKI